VGQQDPGREGERAGQGCVQQQKEGPINQLKGTVSRDFRPSVFSSIDPP
jgi:hypothetical protein